MGEPCSRLKIFFTLKILQVYSWKFGAGLLENNEFRVQKKKTRAEFFFSSFWERRESPEFHGTYASVARKRGGENK